MPLRRSRERSSSNSWPERLRRRFTDASALVDGQVSPSRSRTAFTRSASQRRELSASKALAVAVVQHAQGLARGSPRSMHSAMRRSPSTCARCAAWGRGQRRCSCSLKSWVDWTFGLQATSLYGAGFHPSTGSSQPSPLANSSRSVTRFAPTARSSHGIAGVSWTHPDHPDHRSAWRCCQTERRSRQSSCSVSLGST